MEQESNTKRRFTRRDFLKGFPLGIAGALVIGALGRGVASSLWDRRPPAFPEGSMFRPAEDRRTDV